MEQVVHTDRVLTDLLDSLAEAILLTDRNGTVLFMNQKAAEILHGKSTQPFKGSFFQICPQIQPQDWNNWWGESRQVNIKTDLISYRKLKVPVILRANAIETDDGISMLLISFLQVDQRTDINEVLRQITEATSPVIGGDFFRSLALKLTSCLGIHYALISECANAAKSRVRTLVFIEKDNILENFEYDLLGTPCEIVMNGEIYYCEADLDRYFPKEVGIQSYYGVPIFLSSGEIAGHIAVFDTVPMTISQKETDILSIFASRAGAEIERKHKNQLLAEDHARFMTLFEESPIALWEADFSAVLGFLRNDTNQMRIPPEIFKEDPAKIQSCLNRVLSLGFNKAFLSLFKVRTIEEFMSRTPRLFGPELLSVFADAVISFIEGQVKFSAETVARTIQNEPVYLVTQWIIPPGYESNGSKVIISMVDVTRTKTAEFQLKNTLEELTILKERLQQENTYLREEIKLQHNFDEIVTKSESLRKSLKQVEQVAPTDATVLILGESGTGKELISRAVHSLSKRNQRPLVKVNCATLPANLIESELFGHEKGAFTGATSQKIGRFEIADGGTIFLDEVGEIPLELQAKLLRILQEGEFERLGNSKTTKVDVRVIAATNRKLEEAVKNGEFREDLYYRLNVFPITCPPLRERKEDISLLVRHFCKKYEPRIGKRISHIPPKVLKALNNYHWPGNIRELENVIERGIILSQNGLLDLEDWLLSSSDIAANASSKSLQEIERNHILKVLEETKWKVSGQGGAAIMLGLKPTTLEARMKKLKIHRHKIL